jgi:hypothetical protein
MMSESSIGQPKSQNIELSSVWLPTGMSQQRNASLRALRPVLSHMTSTPAEPAKGTATQTAGHTSDVSLHLFHQSRLWCQESFIGVATGPSGLLFLDQNLAQPAIPACRNGAAGVSCVTRATGAAGDAQMSGLALR